MNTFRYSIKDIKPTQLFISKEKFDIVSAVDVYQPIPIKQIGNNVFFTDGHTRALVQYLNGEKEIEVYWDEDDLDWFSYFENLNWCSKAGINNIAHLKDRILSKQEYNKEWNSLCDRLHSEIQQNKLRNLSFKYVENNDIKAEICKEVLESLPKWFGIDEATKHYIESVKNLEFIAVTISQQLIGFCALKNNYDINLDLFVLGVFEEFHRFGIGEKLIKFIESYAKKNKHRYLSVKTLSENHPDKKMQRQESFTKKVGFLPLEELKELWDENNPCLYMIKPLQKY